ncbi:MAG TPA: peptidase M20 [Verrucomicrobiales bacterium]|nr:peptidase M20 [Verrucomicrobiales bacterium]
MNLASRPLLILVALGLLASTPRPCAAGEVVFPDPVKAHAEVVETLARLIRIDTVNPPGNETRAAEALKSILDADGIPSEILSLVPGRGNLVARIKGNGSKKPLLLMGHTDVVGVERGRWTVDPFGAEIKEGYIYGRGAGDDKSMVAVCFEVFRALHRLKVPLDRDVIFLAEAAEEGTPHEGIDFMVARHWEKIACEFALNEGGHIHTTNGVVQYVGVATTEKVPRQVLLSAKGTSGHGSRPRLDNAVVHLCAAVAKLGEWQPPMRLNETTRAFFQRLSTITPPEEAFLLSHLEDPAVTELVQSKIRASNPGYNSMLRTSISPNIIKAGFRFNVIPADGLATLDVRWLPDENVEAFIEVLRKLVNDPAVEITLAEPGSRKPTPPSSITSEMFAALEASQRKLFPGAVTVPTLLTGATDSAQLRERGVQAYGLGSLGSEEDGARIHGNDERVTVDGVGRFFDFLYDTVVRIAASPQ